MGFLLVLHSGEKRVSPMQSYAFFNKGWIKEKPEKLLLQLNIVLWGHSWIFSLIESSLIVSRY